jgi:hypothetical protein
MKSNPRMPIKRRVKKTKRLEPARAVNNGCYAGFSALYVTFRLKKPDWHLQHVQNMI